VATWIQHSGADYGVSYAEDAVNRERLARIAIDEEVARLLAMRYRWLAERGELPGVEGSMHKLFSGEAALRHYSELVDLLGADGALQPGAEGAPMGGDVEAHFRSTIVGTIYGGSTEIQREIIAERRLGLPKSRPGA
jgi:hypothetical protein